MIPESHIRSRTVAFLAEEVFSFLSAPGAPTSSTTV